MSQEVESNVNCPVFDDGERKKNENVNNNVVFDKRNYLNTRLQPNETKRTTSVRIIPTKDIDGVYKVAIPVNVHNLILSENQNQDFKVSQQQYKSFICLDDPHMEEHDESHKCPLCEKKRLLFEDANQLKDDNGEVKDGMESQYKAICKSAFSYGTKITYIARVIERGYEGDGVKFWRFNKYDNGTGILDKIKMFDETYRESGENIFDFHTGRDIKITLTKSLETDSNSKKSEKTGITLMVDTKQSPISTDENQIQAWLNDPKDWRDMYRCKSYDYLKIIADDQTPVYDKDSHKFVPYQREDESISKDEKEEIKKEVLAYKETPVQPQPQTQQMSIDDDLPF